ncbi:MAG TPA: glycerol-3-phosphate dehydrogenase/oxidase, partial [Burkholderiaceae bacterium]|nr:glycerol-3-phosphate dehydrogenase/oxidase [Burkholderiaceae bacterium]
RLRQNDPWDAVIIGGGATGLGIALDAAARGLRVALIERGDFACGTSSRSTKLIHGGVRYLAQGNISLVREALAERAILSRIAPDIVRPLEFIVPCYRLGERELLRAGLGLYDTLAASASLGPTRWLSRAQTLERLPGLQPNGLRGGVSYWDAQFDDAAMAIALMQTAFALGATPINYVGAQSLDIQAGRMAVVHASDLETGESFRLNTRCVFNAAGVWADAVRRMALPDCAPIVTVSQGSHIVLSAEFLPSKAAMLIPRTADGRVIFLIPWYGALLVGTTDTPRPDAPREPEPSAEEITYLLTTAGRYLSRLLGLQDIRASFSGLRPLLTQARSHNTAKLSREHAVFIERGHLISVVGGKWTTYRRMAIDALAAAQAAGCISPASPDARPTDQIPLIRPHHHPQNAQSFKQTLNDPDFQRWARDHTQARNPQDLSARRTRLDFLESNTSV